MKNLVLALLSLFISGFSYSQTIEGIWNIGKDNTTIHVIQEECEWVGRIKSSDNDKAPIGKVILKDLKKEGNTWKGKLFVIKKQKWVNVKINPFESKMELLVSKGFMKKTVEWVKVE